MLPGDCILSAVPISETLVTTIRRESKHADLRSWLCLTESTMATISLTLMPQLLFPIGSLRSAVPRGWHGDSGSESRCCRPTRRYRQHPFDRLPGATYIPRVFNQRKLAMPRGILNPISIIAVAAGIELPASGLSQRL